MKQSVKTKLSKYMSYLLRHHPEKAGLSLDKEGFVALDDLVKAISSNPQWSWVKLHHIIIHFTPFRPHPTRIYYFPRRLKLYLASTT